MLTLKRRNRKRVLQRQDLPSPLHLFEHYQQNWSWLINLKHIETNLFIHLFLISIAFNHFLTLGSINSDDWRPWLCQQQHHREQKQIHTSFASCAFCINSFAFISRDNACATQNSPTFDTHAHCLEYHTAVSNLHVSCHLFRFDNYTKKKQTFLLHLAVFFFFLIQTSNIHNHANEIWCSRSKRKKRIANIDLVNLQLWTDWA